MAATPRSDAVVDVAGGVGVEIVVVVVLVLSAVSVAMTEALALGTVMAI